MMKSENSHAHLTGSKPDNDPANMSQQHSVLNAFDFAAIYEMDPALCKLLLV